MIYHHTLTTQQLAEAQGVDRKTIDRWCVANPPLPHVKKGKRRRFNLEEVEAFFTRTQGVGIRQVAGFQPVQSTLQHA